MSKAISLSKGYETIVDDEDYDVFSKFKWYADVKPDGRIYAIRRIRIGPRKENKKRTIRLHREIVNAPESVLVDHINNNSLDNRRANLRLATHAENSRNHDGKPKFRKHVKFKGTKKNLNCSTWSARITVDRKSIYLGSFDTEIEAAIAYNKAATQYFGVFAKLNEV